MKKILVILSGRLNFLDEKNYTRLIDSLLEYELVFFLAPWKNHNKNLLKKFKKKYKPNKVKILTASNIKYKNKIKYPDFAGSFEGFFYNWDGFCKSLKYIKNCNFKKWKPDYILRYRSDILPANKTVFNFSPKNNNNQFIIIPDRYHWHGVNDQIFLFPYSVIKIFNKFKHYVEEHSQKNLFFSGEYIFYKFLKKYKIKIIYNNFEYNLMRKKNFKKKILSLTKKTIIPIQDKLNIKILKIFYKLRNFKEFYILKNNRNNQQDLVIK